MGEILLGIITVSELGSVESGQFFAPTNTDLLDALIGQYKDTRARIESVAHFMSEPQTESAIEYFLEGNRDESRGRRSLSLSVKQLFDVKGAVAALNSEFWSKTLALTDIMNFMPQKRRDEWHDTISKNKAPEFEESTVRATIFDLLAMRSKFLAERVDGIFSGLSGEHVTNAPEGFGKRMIISRVLEEYGSVNFSRAGLINDLRGVIAKFMGRDEPNHSASSDLLYKMRGNWGEWVTLDGGALKIRLYKKGTAHIEVHPEMAWRLNQILASLYPLAIPAQFRQRPPRTQKPIDRIQRPLPFGVIELLTKATSHYEYAGGELFHRQRTKIPNTLSLAGAGARASTVDKQVLVQAEAALLAIGGVKTPKGYFEFDYDPSSVISSLCTSGCLPDQKSHQFYPTPSELAQIAVDLADIESHHSVLEPSAGIGAIADLLPKGRTTCIEVSALHSKILQAKGHLVHTGDFLDHSDIKFDRIVMNPPFNRGQWQSHIEHAAKCLEPIGGKLVAVLPTGDKSRCQLPGFDLKWHGPYDNMFAGTGISVLILVATPT